MRQQGWEERLLAVIEAHDKQPFTPGVSDCGQFIIDVVEALLGAPPVARGTYTTLDGAARHLRRLGGYESVAEAIEGTFGDARHNNPAMAQRGDLGTLPDGSGVVFIDGGVVGRTASGVVRLPRSAVTAVYPVR